MRKQLFKLTVLVLSAGLNAVALSQTSGSFWIKTFNPGSSDLSDSMINGLALARLDSLMKDDSLEITFLGAADSLAWKMNGKHVHDHVSEAWNDAKRLSRARALRSRYGRGLVGVTHESIAGVKVVWSKRENENPNTKVLDDLKENNDSLTREIAKLRDDVERNLASGGTHGVNGINGTDGHFSEIETDGPTFNWRLQAGLWSWHSVADGTLLSPSIGLNIVVNKTAFVFQGGVTPWHSSTRFGNKSESFVYTGLKFMKHDRLGFTIGGFRGWEFFTSTDNWSFKTTGLAAGVLMTYGAFEIGPTLTYSNVNTLEEVSHWRLGSMLGLNFNIN